MSNSSQARCGIAQRRERHRRPDRGVRVLAAVLAHAGHVAPDVSRIQRRLVERRIEQLDQRIVAAHQVLVDGIHRRRATRSHSPAPDSTDQLCAIESIWHSALRRRAQRRAVVEIGAAVPLAVPAVLLDIRREAWRLRSSHASAKAASPRQSRDLGELREHSAQEKRQPDAFALALMPTMFMPSFQSPEPISGKPCSRSAGRA